MLLDHQGKNSAVQKTNITSDQGGTNYFHKKHALARSNRIYENQEASRVEAVSSVAVRTNRIFEIEVFCIKKVYSL